MTMKKILAGLAFGLALSTSAMSAETAGHLVADPIHFPMIEPD
jgi:hypothetical protein